MAQSVLTISGLTPGDAGSYVVTISNPYGLETSRAAQLTVLPAGNGVGIASTNGWNGADAAWPFGETETATFGQTFVAPTDSRVVSFTLYLAAANDPDPVDFKFYLMAWDGRQGRRTGPLRQRANRGRRSGHARLFVPAPGSLAGCRSGVCRVCERFGPL